MSTHSVGKSLLVQFNVTRDCNLRCTHCYISQDKKRHSYSMSSSFFDSGIEGLAQFIESESGQQFSEVDVHIIGGEPTLLGIDFFREKIGILRKLSSEGTIPVNVSIVSNLVTKDAVEICKLFDNVSTSFEFDSRFVSMKGRPLIRIENSWRTNVAALQDAGIKVNVTTAMTLPVINHGAYELLDYLYAMGFRGIHLGFFIVSGDGGKNKETMFPEFIQTSNFLIDAYKWYMEKVIIDPEIYVNPVESMIKSLVTGEENYDISCPIITGSIDIDSNGDVRTCTSSGGETFSATYGNMKEQPLELIYRSRMFSRERVMASIPDSKCGNCEYLHICKSACKVLQKHWSGEGECPGFKTFISYVDKNTNPSSSVVARALKATNRWRNC